MEINPLESRLRMLQQIDGVQMQREATPDEETAGCPGCPFFWTCPVPHRGEEVRAPAEIDLADVRDALGPRRDFSPRDESDVGWTDVWLDEEGLPIDPEDLGRPASVTRPRRVPRNSGAAPTRAAPRWPARGCPHAGRSDQLSPLSPRPGASA